MSEEAEGPRRRIDERVQYLTETRGWPWQQPGVVRSRTIPPNEVIGLARSTFWFGLILGYVPSLISRQADGTVISTNLWCFLVSRQALVGAGSTDQALDDLRLTLTPYFGRDL